MATRTHEENVELLLEKLDDADAVMVGAASGMSSAAGYSFYYQRDEVFLREFGAFEERYGFHSGFDGFYYRWPSSEERWAFVATFIHLLYESSAGAPYEDLKTLLEGRNFHVLTTNQDFLFEQITTPDKISAIQGDWRYFQCFRECHDALYPNRDQIYEMYEAIDDLRIPTELVPHCSKCGAELEPWVRGLHFLEGKKFLDEYRKSTTFLDEYADKKLLFLELGVGRMTPMFIQKPFWKLTKQLPLAYYVTINPNDAIVPYELEGKGAAIHEDIAKVFHDAAALLKARA